MSQTSHTLEKCGFGPGQVFFKAKVASSEPRSSISNHLTRENHCKQPLARPVQCIKVTSFHRPVSQELDLCMCIYVCNICPYILVVRFLAFLQCWRGESYISILALLASRSWLQGPHNLHCNVNPRAVQYSTIMIHDNA